MAAGRKRLRVTQKRSSAGGTLRQRRTLRGLGLGRIGRSVIAEDRPEVRGMVARVNHLVVVEEVADE